MEVKQQRGNRPNNVNTRHYVTSLLSLVYRRQYKMLVRIEDFVQIQTFI